MPDRRPVGTMGAHGAYAGAFMTATNVTEMPRAAGILLHPTSLPGPYGIGDLGAGARTFVDWLVTAGASLGAERALVDHLGAPRPRQRPGLALLQLVGVGRQP